MLGSQNHRTYQYWDCANEEERSRLAVSCSEFSTRTLLSKRRGKKSLQATIAGQGEEATKANGDKNDIAVAMRINVSRAGDSEDIPEEFDRPRGERGYLLEGLGAAGVVTRAAVS